MKVEEDEWESQMSQCPKLNCLSLGSIFVLPVCWFTCISSNNVFIGYFYKV